MNLFADESVHHRIVDRLRQDGHTILYVAEMAPGISDDLVLDQANQAEMVLLTADKDFGELVFQQARVSAGVVLIRLAGISLARRVEIVAATIREHSAELSHAFAVITAGGTRVRQRLP